MNNLVKHTNATVGCKFMTNPIWLHLFDETPEAPRGDLRD